MHRNQYGMTKVQFALPIVYYTVLDGKGVDQCLDLCLALSRKYYYKLHAPFEVSLSLTHVSIF